MNVSIVQLDITAKNTKANFVKIEALLADCTSDLVVLPEMFSTGYFTDDTTLAQPMNGEIISWMLDYSQRHSTAICGSLLCLENGELFNRFVMVSQGEILGHYDKAHLFSMANENVHFTPGNTKVDMVLNGFKIRPIICYDLRFPYSSFNDSEYDILINVASWPSQRIGHWDALLRARAIENQAYVIGCNRVGEQIHSEDKKSHYPGHSGVYGPDGERLVHSVKEEVLTLTITQEVIATTRKQLPFLTDRRM